MTAPTKNPKPTASGIHPTALPVGTRNAGLQGLTEFVEHMGTAYAQSRNYDLGQGQHRHVSKLSPYLRHRLLSEEEVVRAAMNAHGPAASEKFVQEVIWRSYFKGWLEQRPQVWTQFRNGLERDLDTVASDPAVSARLKAAENGRTGLPYFDEWIRELHTTGYLHNHARMWFASIWIFTLGLPWRLGADLFLRQLLDGDAASNTCSWRWVAGLHTRGKTYQATAQNIAIFTNGRFAPADADLAQTAPALVIEEPDGLPPLVPLRQVAAPKVNVPTLLLATADDCQLDARSLSTLNITGVARLPSAHMRSPLAVATHVRRFEDQALTDACADLAKSHEVATVTTPGDLVKIAQLNGAHQIVHPYATVGPLHDWLDSARPTLDANSLPLCEWQRDWDREIWPFCTAGFFKVKKRLPQLLQQLGLT